MGGNWNATTSWAEVCRRAGGRRRYNAGRRFLRNVRRAEIFGRIAGKPWQSIWGLQAALARALGVSRSTICRDLRAMRDPAYRMPVLGTCPPHLAHLFEEGRVSG